MWTDQIVLGKRKCKAQVDRLSRKRQCQVLKSQKSRLENFLWAALMWTDQIVLGKEEVQGSSGSIVSKKTINARNWKSQKSRLENFLWAALMWTDQIVLGKEEVQGSSGSIVSKNTINARNWKSQRLEVKSQDLKSSCGRH
ncbi:hypothetical protein TNCV_2029391 [Trichonephila clavipes]|nr:hypothetical protein TNCV_2029391 [Trichonephila clavipes]